MCRFCDIAPCGEIPGSARWPFSPLYATLALVAPPPSRSRVDSHHRLWTRRSLAPAGAGAVARPFAYGADPFRAGWHRGVDLAAPVGRARARGVRGRRRHRAPGRRDAALRPLARDASAAGVRSRWRRARPCARAASLGTVGAGGEHARPAPRRPPRGRPLRVRGPAPVLHRPPATPPTVPPPRTTRVPRTGPGRPRRIEPPTAVPPSPPVPVPASPPAAVPATPASPPAAAPAAPAWPPAAVPATPASPSAPERPHAAPVQAVRVSAPTGARALAPWPAWAGLALLLLGALGGGVRIRARRARVARTTP